MTRTYTIKLFKPHPITNKIEAFKDYFHFIGGHSKIPTKLLTFEYIIKNKSYRQFFTK